MCFILQHKRRSPAISSLCFPESTLEWSNCPLSLSTDISSSLRRLSHSCPPQSHCQIFLHMSVMANSTERSVTPTESKSDTSPISIRKYFVVLCTKLNESQHQLRRQSAVLSNGCVWMWIGDIKKSRLLWISHTVWNRNEHVWFVCVGNGMQACV